MATLTLPLLTLALLLTATLADFDKDDIDDSYSLRLGAKGECADKVELDDDELKIETSDIELDNKSCTGGDIQLQKVPPIPSAATTAVQYFAANNNKVGDFLAGKATAQITCGTATIKFGEQIILLKPDNDLTAAWTSILGTGSPIQEADGDNKVSFDDGTKYLFIGNRCFYAETNLGDRIECFPADATATLQSGAATRMDALRIGDRVLVADGTYSDVFAWTHQSADKSARFYIEITTDAGHRLVSTPGHFVYADGKPVPAASVRRGHVMRAAAGTDVKVVAVARVRAKGLYNPQTVHGDIVVNGLVATSYTTAIEPAAAHALLAPLRAAYKAVRGFVFPSEQSVEL